MSQQIEDLSLIQFLGKGSFGEVYLSTKKNSNKLFATKKIKKSIVDLPKMNRYFTYEIYILKSINHPNIVKLEELKWDNNYYYIVMEYINGGELSKCLEKYKNKYQRAFPEEIVQYLMRQIVDALIYIHDKNIIHRDLKLSNIMVHFDSDKDKEELNMMKAQIKIIDFGFAIMLPSKDSLTKTAVGTKLYMDPKILEKFYNEAKKDENRGYGREADIWSLGCICYTLFRGKIPFDAKNEKELVAKINNGKYKIPKTASLEIISFLDKMLRYEGNLRLSARELKNEPFLKKNISDFSYIDENGLKKQNTFSEKPKNENNNLGSVQNNNSNYYRINSCSEPCFSYRLPNPIDPKLQFQKGMFSMNQFNNNMFKSNFQ